VVESPPAAQPTFAGESPIGQEITLNCSTRQFGLCTVVMLVLLRVTIGWHFFSEGMHHYADPSWSSEGFLRSAKGPFAPLFQSVLPDNESRQAWQSITTPETAKEWAKKIGDSYAKYASRDSELYQFTAEQQAAIEAIIKRRQAQLAHWVTANADELDAYPHERDRLAKALAEPSSDDIPFQKGRVSAKQAEIEAKVRGWLGQVNKIESDLRDDLAGVLNDQQRKRIPRDTTPLEKVDTAMTYGILGIGACLLVGLFTRLAAVCGALFLLSVVMTQPFWVAGATPTYNQWVELVALLVLATTHVGKWGGLDFFLSFLFGGCCKRVAQQETLHKG
jgi:uncharacterized membrane protein YphA (DoxX/SURF4 family)